ncbi:MAG TPA: hypothetical protein VMD91_16285 [Candidatus Sulfotelmatobacter sp.]|nr:hypothetical protein [Candidatus Sulfotelmatobacter sp.]
MKSGELVRRIAEIATFTVTIVQLISAGVNLITRYRTTAFTLSPADLQRFETTTYIVEAVVLFALVLTPYALPLFTTKPEYGRAISVFYQFRTYWFFIWVVWFFWYGVEATLKYLNVTPSFIGDLGLDLLYLASTALFLLCFLVMVLPSAEEDRSRWMAIVTQVFIIAIALVIVEAVATRFGNAQPFCRGFDGLLSGVVLALFVGRFESKLLETPRWLVATLYAYAVLQFAYPVLTSPLPNSDPVSLELAQIFIASLALFFKVLLYWYVGSLMRSGKLIYYFYEYRSLFYTKEFTERRDERIADILTPGPQPAGSGATTGS